MRKVTENSSYNDGFPTDDSHKKQGESYSKDPSRPFDEAREKAYPKKKITKENNPTGTFLNEPDKYRKH